MAYLGEQSLTRRRYVAGAYTAGRWSGGGSSDSSFLASLQPMSERDRQVLPEGLRQRDGRKLYCDTGTLRTDSQHVPHPADEVLISGARFTVVHVDSSHSLINHDRAYLVRVQEGA